MKNGCLNYFLEEKKMFTEKEKKSSISEFFI